MESLSARIIVTPTCIGRWQHRVDGFHTRKMAKSVEFLASPGRCLLGGQGPPRQGLDAVRAKLTLP